MKPTTELEKELLAALGEQVLKVRKLEQVVKAQGDLLAQLKDRKFPSIDPLAVDGRSVV